MDFNIGYATIIADNCMDYSGSSLVAKVKKVTKDRIILEDDSEWNLDGQSAYCHLRPSTPEEIKRYLEN